MKKIISLILAVCLMAGVATAGAVPAQAAGVDEILAVIAKYNLNHGGTGTLVASVSGANEVTITGSVINATAILFLGIPFIETNVIWKATLTGYSMVLSLFNCNLEICDGAYIESESKNQEVISSSGSILISGGTVIGNITGVLDNGLTITGGTITGDLHSEVIEITGGTVSGFIRAQGRISITGGIVTAEGLGNFFSLCEIAGNAVVTLKDVSKLSVLSMYIAPSATVNFFPDNYIKSDASFKNLEVVGWAQFTGALYLFNDVTLTIPTGTTLDLTEYGYLTLNYSNLVIDGTLIYDNSEFQFLKIITGTISGKNAGELAGTYEDGQKIANIIIVDPPIKWWEPLSPFLQFLLRWFCFGWIWMK